MKPYLEHLVSYKISPITAFRTDVKNRTGRLIASKGEAFTGDLLVTLLNAGYETKDISDLVQITKTLSPNDLYSAIQKYFFEQPSTAALFLRFNKKDQVQDSINYLFQFPSIIQQLTVMSLVAPDMFEKSMFCAWFGSTILGYSKTSSDDMHSAFLAGMTHDIGLLHIDTDILECHGELSVSQWNQIRKHPLIASSILKQTRGFPASARVAVEEHHESMDGSGYPYCKSGDQISRVGQTVSLLDTLHAIYAKHFLPKNRMISELIPLIQLNTNTRFGNLGKIVVMMLKILPERRYELPGDVIPTLIEAALARNEYITEALKLLKEIHATLGFTHNDTQVRGLQNAIIHVNYAVSQSGLINDGFMTWMIQVRDEGLEHAYHEIEDLYIMLREVIYHIDKLKHSFAYLLETDMMAQYKDVIQFGLEEFKKISYPPLPDVLDRYF